MSKCVCEEPCLMLVPNHLFEICGTCGKIMELTKFDLWIKNNIEKIMGAVKNE